MTRAHLGYVLSNHLWPKILHFISCAIFNGSPVAFRHQYNAAYNSPDNDGGGVMVPTEVRYILSFSSLLSLSTIRRWFGECLLLVTYTLIKNLTRRKSTSERSLSLYENKRHIHFYKSKVVSFCIRKLDWSAPYYSWWLFVRVLGCLKNYWTTNSLKTPPKSKRD